MNRILLLILIIVTLGTLGILGHVLTIPRIGDIFTNFYILGPESKAADYPVEIKAGESVEVILGITNYEQQSLIYNVQVKSEGLLITVCGPVTLQNGKTYERKVAITLPTPGNNQKVDFLLFKEGEKQVYRSLHLWIDVIE